MAEAVLRSKEQQRPQQEQTAIPPGWTSNPSEPARRLVLAALAFLGFATAVYLTLYELDVFTTVWEPFFGNGSDVILNTRISHPFGIPDASIGAALYFFDGLLLFAGGRDRWKTHPFFVLLNGATAAALGTAALILLIVQPIAYGHYCTLCMFSAFISISLFGPTMDEVLAALQHLGRKYTAPTERQLEDDELQGHLQVNPDWNPHGIRLRHLFGVMIGLWLMASPAAIGFAGYARDDARITGPFVLFLSMLAIWPATRWFGRLNMFPGFWLMFGPILLQAPILVILSDIALGGILVALAAFAGDTASQIGGGWIGILGEGSELPPEEA